MSPSSRPPTDHRRTRKRHERQVLVLVLLTLVVVGGGLIGLIFGLESMIGALPCLFAGAGAILVLYVLFFLAERWANR